MQSISIHFRWSHQEINQLGGAGYFKADIDTTSTSSSYYYYTTNTSGYQKLVTVTKNRNILSQ